MELALSLGDTPKPFSLPTNNDSVGLCIALGDDKRSSSDPPVQLDLLPSTPVLPSSHLPIPWLSDALGMERVTPEIPVRAVDDADDGAALSSPNSAVSSFQVDFCVRNSRKSCEGASDDDENGSTRKKLRLSKEQSAFLEDSFKEHTTLNPKQKLALAKELNLRPRQVEVWFQNRRARTKLKQTEVDCEYLKRCCESLTEENRRLQKELQELRALKTCQPFYMQLPATTLTMCPSCERVATNTAGAAATNNNNASQIQAVLSAEKPRILP
ncbi:Homeobox-leucine zipper protein HAT14 [Spatholobus suberectus]|nr:Homeobox-leucine zipper protein HAT14 [Spatholobus suberectus]